MKNIWQAVFLIVGSIIGAGFASGRELSLFFAEFGYSSLYFLPIVFVLFYYSFKLFLTVGSEHKYTNIFELNKKTNSSIFFNISDAKNSTLKLWMLKNLKILHHK